MRNHEPITIEIVRSVEDLHRAFAVRAVVFLGEQSCPYEEEYDGNDLCATHFLASLQGEVVGVLRVRFFASFAKLERLAVLPLYRGRGIAAQLVSSALMHVQQKGYRSFQLHAQTRFVHFWARWARKNAQDDPFVFSDHEYVTMSGELQASESRLAPDSDPMVLNRPEGAWDIPGVLEASQNRSSQFQGSKIARSV